MRNVIKEITFNGALLDVKDNKVDINIKGLKTNEDGSFEIKVNEVNVNQLVQSEEDILIFDGGAI